MNILPNRNLGIVGDHEFPVENLSLSRCKKYLASCSHDQVVKFWNVEDIPSMEVDGSKKRNIKKKAPPSAAANFFADLVDQDEGKDAKVSSDSDSDSDGNKDETKQPKDGESDNKNKAENGDKSDADSDSDASDHVEDKEESNLRNSDQDSDESD